MLLGVSATLLSLCALVVAIIQTRIAREQQHASVWPYLQIGSARLERAFTMVLENKGVGPAVIRQVEVARGGQPAPTLTALLNREIPDFEGPRFFVALRPGDVVKAGETLRLFHIDRDSARADHLQAFVEDAGFLMRVTYADVYGNCWRSSTRGVAPLPRCPPP
jgi:hypothetical protein